MDPRETENLLYYAAMAQAVALGFRLGNGADGDLRYQAQRVAELIHAPGRSPEEINDDIERAVRAFRSLVETMIGARRFAYGNDPGRLQSNIIGEDTLARARDLLCPGFWPFC